ncbi:hypothetical protein [Streptomyces sp. NEAU-H33]
MRLIDDPPTEGQRSEP